MQFPQASNMESNQTPVTTNASTREISSASMQHQASNNILPKQNEISHQIRIATILPSGAIVSREILPLEEEIKDIFFQHVTNNNWEDVLHIYREHKVAIQTAKFTRSKETALHVAIANNRTDVVKELLNIIDDNAIREMTDDRGENPLHLAASLGQAETCKLLVDKDPELIAARNIDGETPVFLAVREGNKGAFHTLHPKCPINGLHIKHVISRCRRNHGITILNVSILNEHFGKNSFHYCVFNCDEGATIYP